MRNPALKLGFENAREPGWATAAGAKDINQIGGLVPTERGDVRADVLEVRHNDLDRDFTDATDRLEAMAHQWTLDTDTPMSIVATGVDGVESWRPCQADH